MLLSRLFPIAAHWQAALTAGRTLLRHWILLYPLMLLQLVADWVVARLGGAMLQQPMETLLLPLAGFGLVWTALMAAFTAGWVGMACNRLQAEDIIQAAKRAHANAMAGEGPLLPVTGALPTAPDKPFAGPWKAFFEGVGDHWPANCGYWALLLTGWAAIAFFAYTQLTAQGGVPVVLTQLQQWIQAHPDMTQAAFQAQVMSAMDNATPQQLAQLEAFAQLGLTTIALWLGWTLMNVFAPAIRAWKQVAWWQAWLQSLGLVLQSAAIFLLWLIIGLIALVVSAWLTGMVPLAAPVLWLVWLFAQAWLLVLVCELARATVSGKPRLITPHQGRVLADA